jgi:osmotically-inducible protein OsmY
MSPRDSKRGTQPVGEKPAAAPGDDAEPGNDADLEYANYYGGVPGERNEESRQKASTHENHPEHGTCEPKGHMLTDQRIREDICERLSRPPSRFDAAEFDVQPLEVSDVTVEVEGGKVTLQGTVSDRRVKHYIEELVDACPGVQDIENRISVRR